MTTLFVSQPGQVAAFPGVGKLPLAIRVENLDEFPTFRGAITQVGVRSTVGMQLLHSMQQYIYIYVFGERMGDIAISGLAFSAACQDAGLSGPEQLQQYYNQYGLAAYGRPLTVQIGTSPALRFRAFLIETAIDIHDAQHQISHFTLRFNFLPKIAGG